MKMNYTGCMCAGVVSNGIHVVKSHDQEMIKRYCILVLQKKKKKHAVKLQVHLVKSGVNNRITILK